MEFISAVGLKEKLNNNKRVSIIDIREQYELDICKIDAVHIPMADIQKRISEIPLDIPVVILCRSGKRASALVNLLVAEYNMKNICVLEGGILAWIKEVDNQLETY